ncbi:MAG TPA: hypothetical protein VJT09_11575 [Pyrinomonadaceae bacterium]|nr:hypothetical protein [Pyrinomonadaceae bacterium]
MRIGIGRFLDWLATFSLEQSARKRSSEMMPVVQPALQTTLSSVEVPGTGFSLVPVPVATEAGKFFPEVKKRDIMCINLTRDTSVDWVSKFVREAHEIKAKRPEMARPMITILGSTSELPKKTLRCIEQQVVPLGAVLHKYKDKSPGEALKSLACEIAEAYIPFRLRDDNVSTSSSAYEHQVDDLDAGRPYKSRADQARPSARQAVAAW